MSIPDSEATDFLRANVPWFECPDREIEFDYYRRWWILRRHIRHTDAGSVIENMQPEMAYHGRLVTIVWDETGEHYGQGRGLRVLVDGQEVARADTLRRVVGRLP